MIIIDNMDKRPIYEQIVEKIEHLALIGYYKSGEQLPSVKQLACELSLNPNTIQRAYSELERRGTTYSVKGKGSFITTEPEKLSKRRKEQLFEQFIPLVKSMLVIGISKNELITEITKIETGGKAI